MLTEREKHGIAELLHRLESSDLNSLAQTVTSRLIVPESPSDAVQAILLHTDRPADLLRRRKVRKDFLFKYLHDKRVEGVDPTAEKAAIVSHVLALWGAHDEQQGALAIGVDEDSCSLPEAPAPSRNTSYSSLCNLDLHAPLTGASLPQHHQQPNLGLILNRTYSDPSSAVANAAAAAAAAASGPGSVSSLSAAALRRTESNLSMMEDSSSNDFMTNSVAAASTTTAMAPPPTFHSIPTNGSVITTNITSSQAQDLAATFVKWFYEMMNSSTVPSNTATEFKPDHFFADADAQISLQPSPGDVSAQAELIRVSKSGSEVHSALSGVTRKYGITYNPNLCREGVRGIIDPHGLVIVTACGTLHNAASVCGTFHQQFGLVRDPFDSNNWKIKFTNASLVSKSAVAEVPRLEDEASAGQLLELEQMAENGGASSAATAATASTAMALS